MKRGSQRHRQKGQGGIITRCNDSLYYPYLKAFPAYTMTNTAAENGSVVGPPVQTVNPGKSVSTGVYKISGILIGEDKTRTKISLLVGIEN